MPDREKVIKGLETCTRPGMTICYHDSHECPYEGYGCRFQMEVDALELLKEQEAIRPTWSCGKPYCGSCGLRIRGGKYCSECGAPIAWEGR